MPVHRHASEEGAEKVVELFKLVVSSLGVLLSLRTGALLLGSEAIIVRSLFGIDEDRVGV